MAYVRPQVTVDQNLTLAPTSIEREQPAFVFGPNYELHRYSDDSEKAGTAVGTWTEGASADKAVDYPKAIDVAKVDKTYTKLVGDNVVVQIGKLGGASSQTAPTLPEQSTLVSSEKNKVEVNGGYTKLFYLGKRYVKSSASDELTDGIALKVGDKIWVRYTDAGATQRVLTKIAAVEYVAAAQNWDSDSSSEITGAGTLITIEDPISKTVSAMGMCDLVDVLQGVYFEKEDHHTGSGYQWTQPDTGANKDKVVIKTYLTVERKGTYVEVLYADLYVTFRELLTGYSDAYHHVAGAADVSAALGAVDPDNPLAMGVYMACLNAATDDGAYAPPVYFMAVPEDSVDGYAQVLRRCTLTDKAYVFAPTTQDEAVFELVESHVKSMSTKEVKMWRIAVVASKVPETIERLSSASQTGGGDYYAIPISDTAGTTPDQEGAVYDTLRVTKSDTDVNGNLDTEFRTTLKEGDWVRFNYDNGPWGETFKEYKIVSVLNNNTVKVEGGVDVAGMTQAQGGASYAPSKITIYHDYTSQEKSEIIASVSRNMASRRMVNVFPPVFKNNGVQMTGEFAACAVAGLISATEPQQPITNMPIQGIDDIPLTYQVYDKTDLDTIASGGTFIIAQDLPGDLVYVRHQLTTAYYEGNLNTQELSITKNVDSISYAFADKFRPYYGKYNVTPGLIAILTNMASLVISQLGADEGKYGPQLITGETEIRYIRQNELAKDHVDVAIKLGVPYPCNNIDIVLTV